MLLAFAQQIGFDWVKVAVGLVVLFFAIVKHLFNDSKEAGKKRELAQARQKQPQLTEQQAAPVGGQQADPLRSQVEEFLRRAGRQPEANQPQSPQPQQPDTSIQLELITNDRLRSLGQQSTKKPSPPVAAPREKQRPIRRLKQQSVAEHVAERVSSRSQSLAEKTSQLGQRIINEDQQFDNQLKAKFDHTLGTLKGSGSQSAEQQPQPAIETPARQIAAMLANPEGVRQAVLLNEILRRPSDRW